MAFEMNDWLFDLYITIYIMIINDIVFLIAVFHIGFTCVYMPMMYGWKIGITMVYAYLY